MSSELPPLTDFDSSTKNTVFAQISHFPREATATWYFLYVLFCHNNRSLLGFLLKSDSPTPSPFNQYKGTLALAML